MAAHLSDQTMTDLLEGRGTTGEQAHLDSCPACAARLDEARAALELASGVEIPEPPGLYWEALRRNVSRRIAEEPPRRARWGWVLPVAAGAGALVVAFLLLGRPPVPTATAPTLPAWSALPPTDEDEDLFVVSGFVMAEDEPMDWEEGRGLGAFVAALSDEDSEALVEALGVDQTEGEP
jgi:anti-sigma factor RsiW